MSKFQVPSSYVFGMVKKWHVRGNSNDIRQSIPIAWGRQGHKGGVRGPRSSSGGPRVFLSALYIPLANIKLFRVFSKVSSIFQSTSFLLKFVLHCNLPNFVNASNTSAEHTVTVYKHSVGSSPSCTASYIWTNTAHFTFYINTLRFTLHTKHSEFTLNNVYPQYYITGDNASLLLTL